MCRAPQRRLPTTLTSRPDSPTLATLSSRDRNLDADFDGLSRVIRQQHWPEVTRALWGQHFWSPSYCVLSTGGAPIQTVREYITNQRNPNRAPGRPRTGLTPPSRKGLAP